MLSKISKEYVRPVPQQPKRPVVFKLWLLIQDTETSHAMVTYSTVHYVLISVRILCVYIQWST